MKSLSKDDLFFKDENFELFPIQTNQNISKYLLLADNLASRCIILTNHFGSFNFFKRNHTKISFSQFLVGEHLATYTREELRGP
jgi:hypothetical protein